MEGGRKKNYKLQWDSNLDHLDPWSDVQPLELQPLPKFAEACQDNNFFEKRSPLNRTFDKFSGHSLKPGNCAAYEIKAFKNIFGLRLMLSLGWTLGLFLLVRSRPKKRNAKLSISN